MASTERHEMRRRFLRRERRRAHGAGLFGPTVLVVAAALVAGCFAACRADAAAPVGRHWPPAQQVSMDAIDHAPFSTLLKKYVDGDGYVNYAAWRRSGSDWFGEDFGASQAARLTYLKPYLPEAATTLAADPTVRVEFRDYDWSLNDLARKPRAAGGSSRR